MHGEQCEDAVEERDDDGEGETECGGAAAAGEIARAVVLSDEGGAGLVEGEYAVVEENLDGEGRGGGGHDLFAEAVDGCLEHKVRDVEHHALRGGGEADRADAPEDGEAAGDAQEARLEAQYASLVEEAVEEVGGAAEEREVGGEGGASRAPAEDGDEEQVEQDIQQAREEERAEGRARVAAASEDGGDEVVEAEEGHAEEEDAEICQRERQDFLRHGEPVHDGRGGALTERSDGEAGEKGEQDGGVDGAGGVAQPACAERLRDEDVRTEREAEEEVDDETDERRVVADGSHGGRAVIAAEDQRVGGVEELLEDAGEHEWDGEDDDFVP